jgi:hypothetical protein
VICDTRHAAARQSPGSSIVCLEAKDGLIQGRMDWKVQLIYANAWSICGLELAAWASQKLGRQQDSERFRTRAHTLKEALVRALPGVPFNPRELVVSPHPTGAFDGVEAFAERFEGRFRKERLDGNGGRVPEPLWTYFEAAAAHNAMLLGMREEAWTLLSGMMGDGEWDVTAFVEGRPGGYEADPFGDWGRVNGGLDPHEAFAGNMPHNWTSAEFVLAVRDMLVLEQGDRLVLGKGVPDEWLKPGSRFGVREMPTDFGPVTFEMAIEDAGKAVLTYQGPEPPGGKDVLPGRAVDVRTA